MPGEKVQMASPFPFPSSLKKQSPLLLRDYLRDDFSSCSSNGFKSFPRRQCFPTTTVRLLLELDLQNPKPKPKPQLFHQNTRRSTVTTTVSAFHRASEAVLRAVKSLHFHSSSSVAISASGSRKKSLRIPRSLSRRLLRKSFFWRKVDASNNAAREAAGGQESVRWRSFREEKEHIVPPPPEEKVSHAGAASPAAIVGRISTSSSGNSRSDNSKSNNSWSGSEFTADSGESYSGSNNDSGKSDLPSPPGDGNPVSEGLAVTAGEESTAACATDIAKAWSNEEKEQQFSPVSVLDCPFNDEEEEEEEEVEVSSPFDHQTLVRVQWNKKKAMKRTRRFECLAQLQPLDLQKRITTVITEDSSSSSDNDSSSSTADLPPQYSQPCTSGEQVAEEMVSTKAPHELLSIVKERATSSGSNNDVLISKAELLLLDYFEERSSSTRGSRKGTGYEEELEAVEEWISGEPKEMFGGWEVKESRSLYLKHMEEIDGEWRNVGQEEVGLLLEHEIFTTLIKEVLQL